MALTHARTVVCIHVVAHQAAVTTTTWQRYDDTRGRRQRSQPARCWHWTDRQTDRQREGNHRVARQAISQWVSRAWDQSFTRSHHDLGQSTGDVWRRRVVAELGYHVTHTSGITSQGLLNCSTETEFLTAWYTRFLLCTQTVSQQNTYCSQITNVRSSKITTNQNYENLLRNAILVTNNLRITMLLT